MKYVIIAVVFFVSWVVGVFGFAQIIGSLQNLRERGAAMSAFTIIFWSVILIALGVGVHYFLLDYRIVYYVGTGISLLQVLAAGKIQ